MHKNKPAMAEEWEEKTSKGKKLPEKAKKARKSGSKKGCKSL